MAVIWHDPQDLVADLEIWRRQWACPRLVMTSGGFDPLHPGHTRCLLASRKFGGRLLVVVNGDGFLLRKKGFAFQSLAERMEIIAAIAGVSDVVGWDDGSQFVHGALNLFRPDVFTKGGDRSCPTQMASLELLTCINNACRVEYGVGGSEKVQSSSHLLARLAGVSSPAEIENNQSDGQQS